MFCELVISTIGRLTDRQIHKAQFRYETVIGHRSQRFAQKANLLTTEPSPGCVKSLHYLRCSQFTNVRVFTRLHVRRLRAATGNSTMISSAS
ncbi:hypothetical protein DC522_15145 [Microvirga sp. KLBC 81]|nr:hypothetical protein DC522_15145 [Microvirga sp. KLBC 81]